MRYYYKNKDNTGFLNLKTPIVDENYIQITEEEFNELTKPKIPELTAEQKAAYEKANKIAEAQSEGDTATVSQLRDIYKEQLKERKRIRSLLN